MLNLSVTFKRLLDFVNAHRFTVISWSATTLVVVAILTSTLWLGPLGSRGGLSTVSDGGGSASGLALPPVYSKPVGSATIGRQLALKTDVSLQLANRPTTYRVQVGDNLSSIAKQFNIKADSIVYSNQATLADNPMNLTPGMVLTIPPVDGLVYTWQQGDTLDKVADEFKSDLNGDKVVDEKDAAILKENILSYPGNGLDLTNPVIKPGQQIMIPGGQRELIAWLDFVPTYSRGNGTATTELGGAGCPGEGTGSPPSLWPTNGPHTISGNDFGPNHLGIDITAYEGTPVLASGAGVVVYAGWSQYGYGNVIQLDNGGGWSTVYAHLSQINVQQCQYVGAGMVIGLSGSTGNSTGPHLHFEVRRNGTALSPWDIVH